MKTFFFCAYLIITALAVVSCGDRLNDTEPAHSKIYSSDEIDSSCNMGGEDFNQFFEKNLNTKLTCIESNLSKYASYVHIKNKQFIDKNELVQFIVKFLPQEKKNFTSFLDIFFNLSNMIFNGPRDLIKKDNLPSLFAFLKVLNIQSITIKNYYGTLNQHTNTTSQIGSFNFWPLRAKSISSIQHILAQLKQSISSAGPKGPLFKLNLDLFLNRLKGQFNLENLTPELINTIKVVKVILLGGEKNYFTRDEFLRLLQQGETFSRLGQDLITLSKHHFHKEEDYFHLLIQKISEFRTLQKEHNFGATDVLFTTSDIILFLHEIFPHKKIKQYRQAFSKIKKKYIGGHHNHYTYRDFQFILNDVEDLVKRIYFNHKAYTQNKQKIESKQKIKKIKLLGPQEFDLLTKKEFSQFGSEFNKVLKEYRFFLDSQHTLNMGHTYHRSRYGLQSIFISKWAVHRILKTWGEGQKGSFSVGEQQLETFLTDFKETLQEFDLWPILPQALQEQPYTTLEERPRYTIARNTILLADLFQHQSDGDGRVNLPEAVEYLQIVIAALHMGSELTKSFKQDGCSIENKSLNSPSPCYRTLFYKNFLEDLQYKFVLPGLNKYVQEHSFKDMQHFLLSVETFSRDAPEETTHLNKREIALLIGAFMNIESTLITFDLNKDNTLNPNEVKKSFTRYQQTISKLSALPQDHSFIGPIFNFMLKNHRSPKECTLELFKYYLNPWTPDTEEATRSDIGALLRSIVLRKPKPEGEQKISCLKKIFANPAPPIGGRKGRNKRP